MLHAHTPEDTNQYAYTKNAGTTDALLTLINNIIILTSQNVLLRSQNAVPGLQQSFDNDEGRDSHQKDVHTTYTYCIANSLPYINKL